MGYAALKGRSSTVIHTFVNFSAVYEIRTQFFGKLLEIDAAIEAQTQEETFFDCCVGGKRRYRMRCAIHVGVERVGGCEADGLGNVGLDAVNSYSESGATGAAGCCRAALGWTAEGGCPYVDGRGRPSPPEPSERPVIQEQKHKRQSDDHGLGHKAHAKQNRDP